MSQSNGGFNGPSEPNIPMTTGADGQYDSSAGYAVGQRPAFGRYPGSAAGYSGSVGGYPESSTGYLDPQVLPGWQADYYVPANEPRGSRMWGWIIAAAAVIGLVIGILFGADVLGNGGQPDPSPNTRAMPPSLPVTSATVTPESLHSTTATDPAITTPTSSPEPSASVSSTERLGERKARVDAVTIEALEYESNADDMIAGNPAKAHDEAENEQKVVGVKLKITNTGTASVDPYDDIGGPDLYAADGLSYARFGYEGDGSIADIGQLAAGDVVEAWVYFAVPQDFSPGGAELEMWSRADVETVRITLPD
ncbi:MULTISPECIES: DUF4352 domain-containing protein [unclassified Actinobaculum]|uniref:DUF4352 domain-containing protein n=1 Tax=unclassified Actinobaculum TaxID=2609299 RepID=UPI000D529D28|nr:MULTISPECIES: DUF4352 domain-containing protein [unclassified Actinobaculum]AWE41497.1 hypothetical protein DDD63_00500 [Actinobaculum sp. 313]RTE48205.1 DUF4352 domain-containing protein [Actinobaculum sp. 352]